MDARTAAGLTTVYEAARRQPHDFDGDRPRVHLRQGRRQRTRSTATSSPAATASTASAAPACRPSRSRPIEQVYPFGWLGMLSETPPVCARADLRQPRARLRAVHHALAHAQPLLRAVSARRPGRALARRALLGRAARRLDPKAADELVTGPSIEKSIAPLRSFVAEPMRFGRLFLAGDAAHIVPPTGAKGLNLAASDVHYLSHAFREYYDEKSTAGIDGYSTKALARVWKAERFSWWMTSLMHHFPERATSADASSRPSSTMSSTRRPPRRRWRRITSGCRSSAPKVVIPR